VSGHGLAPELLRRASPACYGLTMIEALERMLREVEALPDGEQARIARVLEAEVRKARPATPAPACGRWAGLVRRMRREAPLAGSSEEFLRDVRRFRDRFDLRGGRTGG
jgi:hypothetical protein